MDLYSCIRAWAATEAQPTERGAALFAAALIKDKARYRMVTTPADTVAGGALTRSRKYQCDRKR